MNTMQAFIIIGQASERIGTPAKPLEGLTGRKLADLFGCDYDEYLTHTQRFNILPEWPGSNAHGDQFPFFVARTNAQRMAVSFGACRVLIIGVKVGEVFGFTGPVLKWHHFTCASGKYAMAILPHISGGNRWWNDCNNEQKAQRFMKRTWRKLEK